MRPIDGDALADVLTAISSIKVDTGRSEEWAVTVNAARQAIAQMPTIEPKKGKWINANDGKWNTVEVLKCSVCGETDNRMYRTDSYCPNCGARMENSHDSN